MMSLRAPTRRGVAISSPSMPGPDDDYLDVDEDEEDR